MKNNSGKKQVRYVLSGEEEHPPVIIAMVCPLREYRLAWMLNQNYKTAFKRIADISIPLAPANQETKQMLLFNEPDPYTDMPLEHSVHAQFADSGKLTGLSLRLLSNSGSSGWLLPDRKTMDYFFLIKGELRDNTLQDWLNNLRSLQAVAMAAVLPLSAVPVSKRNHFLFD